MINANTTFSLRDKDQPAIKPATLLDAIAYLAKVRMTSVRDLNALTGGRIWNANEVPAHPTWPFVIIADAKQTADAVRLNIEAWGRWTPESEAMVPLIKRALPSFTPVDMTLQRPNGCSAAAAVACITFIREIRDA